ncbi:MAG: hypothetical protein HYY84_05135 [Deltaproteobacteria bacterium]|nr:hypothetical protein [Deltaproteobacteria bacterium]
MDTLKTVLLLALPASGKSEVRRYLAHVDKDVCRRDFHMGETVQLDDFPYVHMMRRIDDELVAAGSERVFFKAGDKPFQDARDWGTLIELVNEDHADLMARLVEKPQLAAELLMDRIDNASQEVGLPPRLDKVKPELRAKVVAKIEEEARTMLAEKHANYPATLDGKTLVVEFARGGPDGAKMPLVAPLGYRYSLGRLSDALLKDAVILYVWVTPAESRRKNAARTDPNDPGSILHHGVPTDVMLGDYGCDDMDWLEANARTKGAVTVETKRRTYDVPIARFDNRVDKTSFLRDDPARWAPVSVKAVHDGLSSALTSLVASRNDSH